MQINWKHILSLGSAIVAVSLFWIFVFVSTQPQDRYENCLLGGLHVSDAGSLDTEELMRWCQNVAQTPWVVRDMTQTPMFTLLFPEDVFGRPQP